MLRRFSRVAPVVKSLEGQVLSFTAPTTPWPCGGWSRSGRVRPSGLHGGGLEVTPPLHV